MGETKGSLETRTLVEGNKIFTETKSSIEDSDNDQELLSYASKINSRLTTVLTAYQSMKSLGYYQTTSPQKYLEECLKK